MVVATGRLIAYRSISSAWTRPLLTAVAVPPMGFMPSAAMPRLFSSGRTCFSKLRKVASRQLSGICTASKG